MPPISYPAPFNKSSHRQRKSGKGKYSFVAFGRDEATRTPDPYVPNVVRYQLRYIPIADAFMRKRLQRYSFFLNYVQFSEEKFVYQLKMT